MPPPPPQRPFEVPDLKCDGFLTSIAALNLFSILAFAVIVSVRIMAPDRSYTEACIVTYILVVLDILLKLGDATLPVALTITCFPSSFEPPFNNGTLSTGNCVVPCGLGDFFAMYGWYGVSKSAVGVVDVLLATPFLLRKPRDWYRWGQAYLKKAVRFVQSE